MNKPESYSGTNFMQIRDMKCFMNNLRDKFNFRVGENILDVGCGPGDVTCSILRPYLPEDANIVGSDISDVMISYAKAKYSDEKLCFKTLDIENEYIWDEWKKGSFEKIFSFYCLHWIQDQRTALKNLYWLLKLGGELFVIFLAKHPIFTVYEEMSKLPKWRFYLKDYIKFISPYHSSKDPEGEFNSYFESVDLKNIHTVSENKQFNFPSEKALLKAMEAVNPFIDQIPHDLKTDFLDEILLIIKKNSLAQFKENGNVITRYQLITSRAKKL